MFCIKNIKIITSWRKWRKTLNNLRYFLVKTKGAAEIFGDVDGNGEVEVVDATWIQRHLVSIDIPFTIDLKTADVDGDGQIALIDAILIQRGLAHLKSNDKIGKIVNEPTQPTQDEYELPVV